MSISTNFNWLKGRNYLFLKKGWKYMTTVLSCSYFPKFTLAVAGGVEQLTFAIRMGRIILTI